MRSQWYEFKEAAISLRKEGQSIKTIHKNLGVPVSTLSGWLKNIEISQVNKDKSEPKNKAEAWKRAHQKAADWHKAQKALANSLAAKQEAKKVLRPSRRPNKDSDSTYRWRCFFSGTTLVRSPLQSLVPTLLPYDLSSLFSERTTELAQNPYAVILTFA